MTKRIVLVLTVLTMLFTVTTTVASADSHTMKPDGIWEMNDGDDWVRFYERGRMKQAQWHSDSYGPCRGGPATSTSANWSYHADGVNVKIWANCDTARIRLRPFELHFDWQWNGDLFETSSATEWTNYLLHKPPPECIDFGDHSIYTTNVFGADLLFDVPEGEFDLTIGNYEANLVCSSNGCDDWHVDIVWEDNQDEIIPVPNPLYLLWLAFPFGPPPPQFLPPIVIPAFAPDILLEFAGPVRPCETVVCVVQGFVSLPTGFPFEPIYDEVTAAGYATCSAIVGALTP